MATFDGIRSRISYDLSETAPITFTEDELFQYVIEGSRLLHRVLTTIAPSFLLVQAASTPFTIGQSTIVLPTDVLTLYEFIVSYQGKFTALTHTNLTTVLAHQSSSGVPQMWTRVKGGVQIAPLPDAEYAYMLYYVPQYIPPVATTDDLGIPDAFADFAVEYAVVRAHNRNDRQTLVEQSFLNLKLDAIKAVVNSESEHTVIAPTLTVPYWQVGGW